jgi:hypothetical protein
MKRRRFHSVGARAVDRLSENVTTLVQDGPKDDPDGHLWNMKTHKLVTNRGGNPLCKDWDDKPETLSWQDTRRPLTCKFVVPVSVF